MLALLLLSHLLAACVAPPVGRRLGRRVFLVCGLAPLLAVTWTAAQLPALLAGEVLSAAYPWAAGLGLTVDLRLDGFTAAMVALVSGIGVLVFVYAYAYFDTPRSDLGRFASALTGFSGAMLGLVLADNVLLLFVFWELTSVTSYLLIGFDDRRASSRDAALQALLTTSAGGLALLAGVVLIGQAAGTFSLSGILADPPAGAAVATGLLLILIGAFSKSAQVPFHTWLPAAMVAPTPVSAYLHSATMVKGGVYVIARLAPVFAAVTLWRPLVVGVGVATMLVGAYRALRQDDLKLLLAFGTISQLGFLVAVFGLGTPAATFAGVILLLAHGLFKAALFMVVGVVDHAAGTRDLRHLQGLHRSLPLVTSVAVVAAASMAGLPPLLGFIAKEAVFQGFLEAEAVLAPYALAGLVAGSVLTVAYSARFVWGGFLSPARSATEDTQDTEETQDTEVHAVAPVFVAPAVVLAVLSAVLGLLPLVVDAFVNAGTRALDPSWGGSHLQLWHGFSPALAMSAVAVGLGTALFLARGRVAAVQQRLGALVGDRGSDRAYRATVRGLLVGAGRLTGVMQNGSLPVYLTVMSLTIMALPASALLAMGRIPVPRLASGGMEAGLAAIVSVAAVAVVAARRRFAAVLLLGAVGYGVALLFVLAGAPDLALTQFLVETLSVVLFVLVLRHLPDRFSPSRVRLYAPLQIGAAVLVGLFMTAFSLIAAGAGHERPVSEEYLARSLPEAEGRNVVNVILVDFRAMDTMGEITVLMVAAVGIASLIMAGRLDAPSQADRQATDFPGAEQDLADARTEAAADRDKPRGGP